MNEESDEDAMADFNIDKDVDKHGAVMRKKMIK